MDIREKHIAMVEAVNNATTRDEHERAESALGGFRAACDILIPGNWFRMEADLHYMDQGVDRPLCCGVFCDWAPETSAKAPR